MRRFLCFWFWRRIASVPVSTRWWSVSVGWVERSETHRLAPMNEMMGIAEPVIGRAFARPVGSTHPTRAKIRRIFNLLLGTRALGPGYRLGRGQGEKVQRWRRDGMA
jgi:hypothetical protein